MCIIVANGRIRIAVNNNVALKAAGRLGENSLSGEARQLCLLHHLR